MRDQLQGPPNLRSLKGGAPIGKKSFYLFFEDFSIAFSVQAFFNSANSAKI